MSNTSRQDNTIEQFCRLLSQIEQQSVFVLERPDRAKPGTGGCDAIIQRGEVRSALEHTTIDSYTAQRADDARFRQFIRLPLEEAVRSEFTDSWVEIIVPANALPTGTDWAVIQTALLHGCLTSIRGMPFSDDYLPFRFSGVPFCVRVMRSEDGSSPGCAVLREAPANVQIELTTDMQRALQDKSVQLGRYKAQGFPTILLLDCNDTALVNRYSVADAFSSAAHLEKNAILDLDEVFIAGASHNPIWFFPVKLHERIYPALPEFEQYRKTQYRLTYQSQS